jgi:leucine dehydrogenase
VRRDGPTGTWIFVALHDDTLGTPTGGTRLKVYPTPAHGLQDAMRLAAGMTSKWAAVDMDYGGGKAVLAVPEIPQGEVREGLFRRFGRLLRSLHGSFGTGVDLGATPEDMLVIAREAPPCVHGVDPETGETKDPGPYTAKGVLYGLEAAVRHVHRSDSLQGCVVHVQGLGDVGNPLARMLHEAGARLVLSDLDRDRAADLASALGAETVEAERAHRAPCDVYAPCAVGATLSARSIPELECRIVAGSANNQLDKPEDAEALHARGILYAPDYVINAGGAVSFGLMSRGVTDSKKIDVAVERIGTSLSEIFAESSARDESPFHAARRLVERRLRQARH